MLQIREREGAQAVEGEGSGGAQILEGSLNGFPSGILGEIGAEYYFKGRVRRPPVLRTVGNDKLMVYAAKTLGRIEVRAGLHGRELSWGGDCN